MERYIGGEFWYDDTIACQTKQIEFGKAYFTSGGRASLHMICDYLKSVGIRQILLPEYICPTVLDCFDYKNIKYDFYKIDQHFAIDLDDLQKKSKERDAILFLAYFGFSFSNEEIHFISKLKNAGKTIIEDHVQMVFNPKRIGDFSFNSFRKFVPYDGSLLYSEYSLDEFFAGVGIGKNARIPLIREARGYKKRFIRESIGEETEALGKFIKAEETYYSNLFLAGDLSEKAAIEKLDWSKIITKRRENYEFAMKQLLSVENVELIHKNLYTDDIPIGMPFYIRKKNRDSIRKKLRDKNIFLPVHWDLRKDQRFTKDSIAQSECILTCIIDQRYGEEEIHHIAESMKQILSGENENGY